MISVSHAGAFGKIKVNEVTFGGHTRKWCITRIE